MTGLICAVFVASLMGSMHCAGMCGAFLAFALAADERPDIARWKLQAAYHVGRLLTYVSLGAIGGLLGAAVDLSGSMMGVQRGAAVLAGTMMIGFGILALLRLAGVRTWQAKLPVRWQRMMAAAHQRAFEFPPIQRAFIIGLLTTLLPCGWLYAFVITAAGTASPALGALTMVVFWLGTLPVMAGLGLGIQQLTGALRQRVPIATSVIIVLVGIYTVMGRMHVPALAASATTVAAEASIDRVIENVQAIDQKELPCCHAH